ncbi:MAG TPA: phosphonate ABC transporter, permease protein PhnE [Dehalococcoidia bacterium]|nr:phosphonate ABC transporter, permease protein PhnE [Dehalococcoidia bacterium]
MSESTDKAATGDGIAVRAPAAPPPVLAPPSAHNGPPLQSFEGGVLTTTFARPRGGSSAPRQPLATGGVVLVAQALVPGLGYALLRRPLRGAVTLVMFTILILALYWQFPKDAWQPGVAWFWFGLIAGAVWLNLLYRTARELPLLAAGDGSDAATLMRLRRGQRQGFVRSLCGLNLLAIALVVFGLNRLAIDSEVDFALFTRQSNLQSAQKLASGLLHPKWSIAWSTIHHYAWITLEMAILGTAGGALVAAPFSFLAARNLMGRHPVTQPVYYVMRFLFSCIRAIPTLIWGLMAISFTLGHFPGVIALSIFSFGLLAKLYSEAIEAIDWGQIEAVTAAGANPLQVVLFAVVPQVIPYFISSTLYSLEVNVHSSVVLGLIGAGGLGLVINEYIGAFAWSQTSMVLIITIVMTLAIDYGSAFIRSRVV